MITLSIRPDGTVQAFCEAIGTAERGYFLDLPEDPTAFKRLILQALVRRQGRANYENPDKAVDTAEIAKWLRENSVGRAREGASGLPEASAKPPGRAPGRAPAIRATLADLEGLF